MSKLRVMHIVLGLKFGGLEMLVIDLAASLNRGDKIESIICCLADSDDKLVRKAEAMNVKVIQLSAAEGWAKTKAVKQLVRDARIDILHTHNANAHVQGAVVSLLTGKPLVHTKHGNTLPFAPKTFWSRHHWAALMSKKIVAVAALVRQTIIDGYRVPADKVVTIYNGIDLPAYQRPVVERDQTALRKQLGIKDGRKIIGNVARFSVEKDHPTLFEALRIVVKQGFDSELVLVGDGDLRRLLMEKAKELDISDRVKFCGYRQDIRELLGIFDIFVLSSTTEGVSLTLLEAMAVGKPVVATQVGGNPEVVEEGKTGLLAPSRNPAALAAGIIKVLNNPALAKRMGDAGRQRVEELFSLDAMVAEYLKIYKSVNNK